MPCPVFPELLALVLPETDRVPSETCVEREECSLPSVSGGDGTAEATLSRKDTPSPLLLLLQPSSPSSKLEDTESTQSLSSLSLSVMLLRRSNALAKLSASLRMSVLGVMSRRSLTQSRFVLVVENSETEDTAADVDLWSSTAELMFLSSRL